MLEQTLPHMATWTEFGATIGWKVLGDSATSIPLFIVLDRVFSEQAAARRMAIRKRFYEEREYQRRRIQSRVASVRDSVPRACGLYRARHSLLCPSSCATRRRIQSRVASVRDSVPRACGLYRAR